VLRAASGIVLGVVARLWLATLRLRVEVHPELERSDAPWVLAFFHGTQWPLLAWRRRRPTLVMVSLSDDGALQSRALAVLGFEVVRGSSSRGGARGLAGLVRRLRAGGRDAAFAVDGPRGPYGSVKPGASLAARAVSGVVVPMGSAVRAGHVFARAWDRFTLAWPFTTVAVVLGRPLQPEAASTVALGRAVAEANARAAVLLGSPRASGAASAAEASEAAPSGEIAGSACESDTFGPPGPIGSLDI
jgi:lysophospholipid acyltransferase (LPLAT)-like uncharacterized protein